MPHEIRQNGGDKGLLRRNQFGFNVAGPAVLPHLCRTAATLISRSPTKACGRISRARTLQTIPTMAQRTGDYSDVVDDAGNVIPIYDPATTSPNPAYDPTQPVSTTNLAIQRVPFPGNIIPPYRLDPGGAQRAQVLSRAQHRYRAILPATTTSSIRRRPTPRTA